ncbi:hypothetical protein NW768_004058 [Fusarium equiseti]|uniref:Uncharacterized protein n=1 Tax=Fusarium equiseti TaxID=61235 RepID=A0ABQ8RJC8_FUSEQ|nr:hypothetical protein NW768_004058 [Fusarium equiseti]
MPARPAQGEGRETDRLMVVAATEALMDENRRLRREILSVFVNRQDLRNQNEEAENKAYYAGDGLRSRKIKLIEDLEVHVDQSLTHRDSLEVESCEVKQLEKEKEDLVDSHALEKIDMSQCHRREIESLENEYAVTQVKNMLLRQALEENTSRPDSLREAGKEQGRTIHPQQRRDSEIGQIR